MDKEGITVTRETVKKIFKKWHEDAEAEGWQDFDKNDSDSYAENCANWFIEQALELAG